MNGRTQPPIHPSTHPPIHPFTHHPPTHSPIHASPPLVSPASAQESMEDMRFTSHKPPHPPLPASSHTCGTPAVRDTDCTIVPNGSPTDLQRCTGCTVLYCTVLYCTVPSPPTCSSTHTLSAQSWSLGAGSSSSCFIVSIHTTSRQNSQYTIRYSVG